MSKAKTTAMDVLNHMMAGLSCARAHGLIGTYQLTQVTPGESQDSVSVEVIVARKDPALPFLRFKITTDS